MSPKSIVWFEILILSSLVLGVFKSLFTPEEPLQQVPLSFVLFVQASVLAVTVVLTLLTSRRRSKIAKWVLVVLYLLGLPLYFKMVGEGSLRPSIVQVVQLLLQTIGYASLFAPSARAWMNEKPA
jgi:predicted membrane channel-forming protein YqfA (hemolysin III family)